MAIPTNRIGDVTRGIRRIRNPHPFVFVEAPDDKGQVQHWAVEWLAALQLNRQGVMVGWTGSFE
jgi:hypothetical protein